MGKKTPNVAFEFVGGIQPGAFRDKKNYFGRSFLNPLGDIDDGPPISTDDNSHLQGFYIFLLNLVRAFFGRPRLMRPDSLCPLRRSTMNVQNDYI